MKKLVIAITVTAFALAGCRENLVDADKVPIDQLGKLEGEYDRTSDMLTFESEAKLFETLTHLQTLSPEELKTWGEKRDFISLKQVFNEVLEAEWAISDYFEEMTPGELEAIGGAPAEPITSEVLDHALTRGYLRLVSDPEGDYFDYNIYEVNLAPVLNVDGFVKIGNDLYQYGLDQKRILEGGSLSDIPKLLAAEFSDADNGIIVINYLAEGGVAPSNGRVMDDSHSWTIVSSPNSTLNGTAWWRYGKRRYRAYVQGSSYEEDDVRLYCTNVLRAEGQKKNFWGNWKYSELYSNSGNVSWQWVLLEDGFNVINLPNASSIPPSVTSPFFRENGSGINNAFFNLMPHINGYYSGFPGIHDCGPCLCLCGDIDAIRVGNVTGSFTINGVQLNFFGGPSIPAGPSIAINLARNATVSASSTYPGYSVQKIKDGSRNTTVGGAYSWANNHPGGGSLPEWVKLDLGSTKSIGYVKIFTSNNYELQNFSVQTSTNNSTWTTRRTVTGNQSRIIETAFSKVNARYVRIYCTKGPNNQTIYARLNEVEVYGQ
ncbi:MAG: discoidin domain-containing protein [Cyclobacteriaceae bacterium]|nr:discoidin domain-containing protein [Cyclobacteriaceae bacterium HetDA_MAG_MS6]